MTAVQLTDLWRDWKWKLSDQNQPQNRKKPWINYPHAGLMVT